MTRARADDAAQAAVSFHEAGDPAAALAAISLNLETSPTHLDSLLCAGHALFVLDRSEGTWEAYSAGN